MRRLTDGRGVDVVFEHTGAATWPGSILSLKKGGRLVTCGATSGFDAQTDLRHVFYRHLTILGSMMGSKADLLAAMKFIESGTNSRGCRSHLAFVRSAQSARVDGRACAVWKVGAGN